MKKGIFGKLIVFLTAALILTGFSAFGAVPGEGIYTLFGIKNEGYTMRSDAADASSVLTLTEDGKGDMMNCPRCGGPMTDGICNNCGFPVIRRRKIVCISMNGLPGRRAPEVKNP